MMKLAKKFRQFALCIEKIHKFIKKTCKFTNNGIKYKLVKIITIF